MSYNVQGARPVFLVDDAGNSYSASAGAGGGALDASFQQITASGTLGALNATQAITVGRRGTLTLHTTGVWVGTISLQASLDGGTTWVTINQAATWTRQSTGAYAATITVNDIYQASVLGYTSVRVNMTSYTSGTANVFLVASDESAMLALDTPLPPGGNTVGTVLIGTAGNRIGFLTQPSPFFLNTAATTNATSVKASSATVFEIDVSNLTASTVYLKLYNKASAPTVGTDVPVATIPVTAGAFFAQEFSAAGKAFNTGLAFALTGAAADTDSTAIAAGAHVGISYT